MRSSIGIAVLLLTAGCMCGEEPEAAPKPAAEAEPDEELLRVDPSTTGTLSGAVTYSGEAPAGAELTMVGGPECIAHWSEEGGLPRDDSLLVSGGRLENAFVWISTGLEGYAFDEAEGTIELDQLGCVYEPRVMGMQVGQVLVAKNSDNFLHNVHSKPENNREENFGLPFAGQTHEFRRLRKEEVMVPIVCDIHAWMKSWLGIVRHPYFAVTGEDGAFELDGVPPGTYTVQAWHEVLGTREVTVTLPEDGSVAVEGLAFSP